MLTNLVVCDLCPVTTPSDSMLLHGFTRLNLQGEGNTKFRHLLGADCAAHIDLCSECFAAFLAWAAAHKASHQPGPVADPVVEPVIAHVKPIPEPIVEQVAEHAPEPSPEPAHVEPATHEETPV